MSFVNLFLILVQNFIAYLISFLFFYPAATYLTIIIPILIEWVLNIIKYQDPKKKIDRPDYPFAFSYIYMITVMSMLLCFATSMPLALFLGLAFFFLQFLLDRFFIVHFFARTSSSTGFLVSSVAYLILIYIPIIFTINYLNIFIPVGISFYFIYIIPLFVIVVVAFFAFLML
jgi:hypothetical protein